MLKNKKILMFLSLPHHLKRLMPIKVILEEKGARVKIITTNNVVSRDKYSSSFEYGLIENKIPYIHAYDYLNSTILKKINSTLTKMFPIVLNLFKKNNNMFSSLNEVNAFDSIRETIEHYFLFTQSIKKEKPDIVCALQEGTFWSKILFYISAKKNLLNISFQEGLWYENSKFWQKVYKHMADYSKIFVWGKQSLEIGKKAGARIENFEIIGNIEYDKYFKNKHIVKKTKKKKYIVGLFPAYHNDIYCFDINESIRFLYDNFFKKNKNYYLIVKLHPLDSSLKLDEFKYNNVKIIRNGNSINLLKKCDAVIPIDSTIGIEALVLSKPVFELHYKKFNYRHSMEKYGGAEKIIDIESLHKIKKYCEYGISTEFKISSEKYLNRMLDNTDGCAKERFIKSVEKLLIKKGNLTY